MGFPLPISVVIPAYRRPEMVARAIRSVHAQTRPASEILVIDDASGDATGSRAAELGVRVIAHAKNLGEGATRNTGIQAASNSWVALLDCDDEWLPFHLETVWEARGEHVLVGTSALGTGSDPSHHRVYGWTGSRPRVLYSPGSVATPENKMASGSSVLLRRDAALAAGGFRPLKRAADLDLWMRLLEHGSVIAVPRVTVLYHFHPGQVSFDPVPMEQARTAVLGTYRDRPWFSESLVERHEGVIAWDTARAALAAGAPRASTAWRFARRVSRPHRVAGVVELLVGRFRGRRMAARLAPGGGPSVAVLPGVEVDPVGVERVVDLRGRALPRLLVHLVRRPPSRAIVSRRRDALAVRALGIEPVKATELQGNAR